MGFNKGGGRKDGMDCGKKKVHLVDEFRVFME